MDDKKNPHKKVIKSTTKSTRKVLKNAWYFFDVTSEIKSTFYDILKKRVQNFFSSSSQL